MYTIEEKKIDNKPYLYAVRRVKIGTKTKRIRVYLGKSAPKTNKQNQAILQTLQEREQAMAGEIVDALDLPDSQITNKEYCAVERSRITHQYAFAALTPKAQDRWWRDFAIRFIFESNKIEGSRLSQAEVSKIVKGKAPAQSSSRTEIVEVHNALEAMQAIRTGQFTLNERGVLGLHALITKDLGIESGFKKKAISVNNTNTTPPGQVRKQLAELIRWWKEEQNISPFYKAILFHHRFEAIHPFVDGNGRTGRFILLWMLIRAGYDVILFRDANRQAYFSALSKADDGQRRIWLRYAMKVYIHTMQDLWQDY